MEQMAHLTRALSAAGFIAVLATGAGGAAAQTSDPESILNARCAACHEARADGKLSRIADMRKTPEGWDMTLVRMDIWHGVKLPAHERGALVKYLSDTQGLAPEESAVARYILERAPNVIEPFEDEDLMAMCGRCHTFARVALQYRDADEWLKLNHTHMGQWPTLEYQALGRDREWWKIANTDIAPKLGKAYPLKTAAWDAWKGRAKANLEGVWRIVGHRPGSGDYQGTATVTRSAGDLYDVTYELTYADGASISGTGNAIVYTGYEWRGSVRLGSEVVQEVYAVSADGNAMSGRWFLANGDEVGATMRAVRQQAGQSEIMAVAPSHIRAGATAVLSIHGVNLGGKVTLGPGVEVVEVLVGSGATLRVRAKAAAGAAVGPRDVTAGATTAAGALTVYSQVDSVQVEPGYAIARVGGGTTPAVTAQFEAVGYANGGDGEAGTDDDIRIGVMPATWSIAPFNEIAEALEDVKFVGVIQPNGMFMPAAAGPNPERPFKTNNAGDISINAAVDDAGRKVEGAAHLIVTVQRWNDPPIR